jgi:hypothetical protein
MRKATLQDLDVLSELSKKMHKELFGDLASNDIALYNDMIKKHIENNYVIIDKENRGFFIMVDDSVPVINQVRWSGISIYILPEFRKSKLLSNMYKYMFSNFNGIIVGFTEANSEHNKVLIKRHRLLGYVYEINRSL